MTPVMIAAAGVLGFALGRSTKDDPPLPMLLMSDDEKVRRAIEAMPLWMEKKAAEAKAEGRLVEKMGALSDDLAREAGRLAGMYVATTPGIMDAVAAYHMLIDPETSMMTKTMVAGALLYLVSPLDVLPDEIPGLGVLDDAAVLKYTLSAVASSMKPRHYEEAREWFERRGIDVPFYEPVVSRIGDHADVIGLP